MNTISHAETEVKNYPQDSTAPSSFPLGLSSIRTNCDNPVITDTGQILSQFYEYKYKLISTPCTILHLGNKSDDSEAIFRVLRTAGSRYFDEGRRRIQKKLYRRLSGTSEKGILMTCTVDTKKYDQLEAWQAIWGQFKKLRDALNQYRMRNGIAAYRLRYIAVLEQTQQGYPHLHVFFPGLRFLIDDLSKLDGWFEMGGPGSVDVEVSKRAHSARGYVLKYIGKMSGWSDLCMAILWKYGIRLYNMSHNEFYLAKEAAEWIVKAVYSTLKEMVAGLREEFGLNRVDVLGILEADTRFIYIRSP